MVHLIQTSFRIVPSGKKGKPKAPHVIHQACHQILGFLTKKCKGFEFCYPLWNPENPIDRVAVVPSRAECKALPRDRLWILVGMGGTPRAPPPHYVSVPSLDAPCILEALTKGGLEKLAADPAIAYRTTLPLHEEDRGWVPPQDPAQAEAIMEVLPEITSSVVGILEDTRGEMSETSAGLGAALGAVTSIIAQVSEMKEEGRDWGETADKEATSDRMAPLGSLVGLSAALVTHAQGLSQRESQRLLKRLTRKPARLDGMRRLDFKKDRPVEFYSGHRSLWLA